jgi:hypothetical protein
MDAVTEAARAALLPELEAFLERNPEWSEWRLFKDYGFDVRFGRKLREGKSFFTLTGDRLLKVMAKIETEKRNERQASLDIIRRVARR